MFEIIWQIGRKTMNDELESLIMNNKTMTAGLLRVKPAIDLFNARIVDIDRSTDSRYCYCGKTLDIQNIRKYPVDVVMIVIGIRMGIVYVDSINAGFYAESDNGFVEITNIDDKDGMRLINAVWKISLIIAESEKNSDNQTIKTINSTNIALIDGNSSFTVEIGNNKQIHKTISKNNERYMNTVHKPADYEERMRTVNYTYGNATDNLCMMLFESISSVTRQHIFILCDDGGTGKTSLMNAFKNAYPSLIAGVTVQTLTGGAFEKGSSIAAIKNKTIIIADESDMIDNSSLRILGSISTGLYDMARYGNGQREQVFVKAIPIIATNSMPEYDDIPAFKRRAIIISNIKYNDDMYWWEPVDKNSNITVHDYLCDKNTVDAMIFHGMEVFEKNNGKYDTDDEDDNTDSTSANLKEDKMPVGVISEDLANCLDEYVPEPGAITDKYFEIKEVAWSEINKHDKTILKSIKCDNKPCTYKGKDSNNTKRIQRVLVANDLPMLRKLIDKSLKKYDPAKNYEIIPKEEYERNNYQRMLKMHGEAYADLFA